MICALPRFFVENAKEVLPDSVIHLSPSNSRHLTTVLRKPQGSCVGLLDGSGRAWLARLEEPSGKQAALRVLQEVTDTRPALRHIELAIPFLKGEKMDLVLQKATEIGVSVFHIFPAERSVVRLDRDRSGQKLARFTGIVTSAAEQCGAFTLPRVRVWDSLEEFFSSLPDVSRYIAWENESGRSAMGLVQDNHPCVLASGPEGGFSEREILQWEGSGFQCISLGRRILRAETAAIALAALALCPQ